MYRNNLFKYLICAFAILLLFLTSYAIEEDKRLKLEDFAVDVATESGEFVYTIKWWEQEAVESTQYYITLPYHARDKEVRANFQCDNAVFFDGVEIENGSVLAPLQEGNHVISCAKKIYNLYVFYGSDIPTLHIATESGSLKYLKQDRDNRELGHISIVYQDELIYRDVLEYIKGRGNYTWTYNKKPFNLKFLEKVDLFGMGESDKWCLLANSMDGTMLKNKLGYEFADKVGLDFSSQAMLVDVYINNEYMGNYTLSETVEVGENRVDIVDLEALNAEANAGVDIREFTQSGTRGKNSYLEYGSAKWIDIPNNPVDFTGGYLLEFELASRYDKELCGFISNYGQPVVIKSPEYASCAEVEYIRDYYQAFEDAVMDETGYNAQGKHYSDYVDVTSIAKMYVYQEFIKNLDGAATSLFFYKNPGEKIVAGPVWDVDLGFGYPVERDGVQMDDPGTLWITGGHLSNELSDKYSVFSLLCQHEDFINEAKRQWKNCFEPNIPGLLKEVDRLYENTSASIVSDKCKWTVKGNHNVAVDKVDSAILKLKIFIKERSEFLSEHFQEDK